MGVDPVPTIALKFVAALGANFMFGHDDILLLTRDVPLEPIMTVELTRHLFAWLIDQLVNFFQYSRYWIQANCPPATSNSQG